MEFKIICFYKISIRNIRHNLFNPLYSKYLSFCMSFPILKLFSCQQNVTLRGGTVFKPILFPVQECDLLQKAIPKRTDFLDTLIPAQNLRVPTSLYFIFPNQNRENHNQNPHQSREQNDLNED
jgi:hypothetical protein